MRCPLCTAKERLPWAICRDGRVYWECALCGLVWLDEAQRLTPALELARYQEHRNSTEDSLYLEYLRKMALPVAALLEPGSRGLDFGCGPAEGMKTVLEPMGFAVESYDPMFFHRPELLNFRYDFVLCSEVAEHFFSPDKEFLRLGGMVKPGGILAISSRLLVTKENFPNWSYRRDPTHVVFFSERTVHWLANKFHWRLLELRSPLWIYQVLSSGG